MSSSPCTLLEAACCGNAQLVISLLESVEHNHEKGGMLEQDRQGYSAAAWACCQDDVNILRCLLEASLSFYQLVTHRGATLLHLACQNKSLRCLKHLLDINKCNSNLFSLDGTNHYHETPLHLAAGIGHKETTEMLLQAGAARMVQDQYGRSPHTVSIQNGYSACAECIEAYLTTSEKQLLNEEKKQQKESVAIKNHDFLPPEERIRFQNDLLGAVKRRPKCLAEIHEKHIFNENIKNKEQSSNILNCENSEVNNELKENIVSSAPCPALTPLSKLVEFPGDINTIRSMLEDGLPCAVDAAGKDMFGLTALHKFASWNKTDIIEVILPFLSDDDVNITGGSEGYSALHHCIEMNAQQSLDLLLSYPGINENVKDKRGRSYRELAHELGHDIMLTR